MSIYGSNPSRSTWQFDGVFNTYDEMSNAKSSILYGRHVFLTQADNDGHKAGIYQRTDNNQAPFIFLGDLLALNLQEIEVEPDYDKTNTGRFIEEDGNIKMQLKLGTLLAIEDLSITKTSILKAKHSENEPVTIYNFPDPSPSSGYTPGLANGFDLIGDGVTIDYKEPDPGTNTRAQVILTAAPSWRQFPATAAESVTANYDDTEGAVTLSNMNYNYDSQSNTLTATIEDESDNA